MTKKIVVIVGPTAIGKTKLSIKIAKILNTEIISCDSRQFYKELKIGSAPPSKEELSEIKHHFVHNLSVDNEYTSGQFEIDALKLIKKIHQKKDIIIIVGGSGLYIDAICKGFNKIPKISEKIRKKAILDYKKNGLEWLQKTIIEIENNNYLDYDLNNPHRLLRVLEVFLETGKKLSSYKKNKIENRPFEIIKIGLNTERSLLYKNINKRVDKMIKDGLINEVKSLANYRHKNALQTLGYKELFAFLDNEYPLHEAIEKIKKNTRRFAKRQLTWFRKDKKIKWYRTDQVEEIKKFILKL